MTENKELRAKISIFFKEINGFPVTPNIAKSPALMQSTDKTIGILCKELQKYFEQKKIKTTIFYVIENE